MNTELPPWLVQTSVLTHRTFLNNLRNVGVFWMRLAMYMMLCLGIAFVYFQVPASIAHAVAVVAMSGVDACLPCFCSKCC